jgi:hypothetical protein
VQDADEESATLRSRLDDSELAAFVARCDALLSNPVLPEMYPWRCVPWPMI